jgi:hypothetical protein
LDVSSAFNLCVIVNTADYITEEIPQLGKYVQKKIDPALASQIDFSRSRDRFFDTATKVVQALATRLNVRLESWLEVMGRTNWVAFKEPGDQSTYVRHIHSAIREVVPVIATFLTNPVYFRSFCDAFANGFLKQYGAVVAKCRRVGGEGAQQLFVDATAIEAALLELPMMTSVGSSSATASETNAGGRKGGEGSASTAGPADKKKTMPGLTAYRRFVEAGMRRHKMLFKVLGMQAPLDILVENFSKLLGPSASITLLNHVLDIRGVTKTSERNAAIKLAEEAQVPPTASDDVLIGSGTANAPHPSTSTSQGAPTSVFAAAAAAAGELFRSWLGFCTCD